MLLHETDRAVLAHMAERAPGGLSSIFEALSWYAAEREEKAPPGPERERWATVIQVATQATVATRAVGL